MTDVTAQVVAYSLEDGRSTLTETNSTLSVIFATDSRGSPTEWALTANMESGLDAAGILVLSGSIFAEVDQGRITECFDPGGPIGCSLPALALDRGSTELPGTWTAPPKPGIVPLAGIPLLTGLALAIASTGALALRRRRTGGRR